MEPWIPQLVIALVALASGIVTLVTTRIKDRKGDSNPGTRRHFRKSQRPDTEYEPVRSGTSLEDILQKSIDRIERLEQDNAALRANNRSLRQQLSDHLRAERNERTMPPEMPTDLGSL